jgi:hypothetical protein
MYLNNYMQISNPSEKNIAWIFETNIENALNWKESQSSTWLWL